MQVDEKGRARIIGSALGQPHCESVTPLMCAACIGNVPVLKHLLEAGESFLRVWMFLALMLVLQHCFSSKYLPAFSMLMLPSCIGIVQCTPLPESASRHFSFVLAWLCHFEHFAAQTARQWHARV